MVADHEPYAQVRAGADADPAPFWADLQARGHWFEPSTAHLHQKPRGDHPRAVYPPPEGSPATIEEWEALPEDSPYKDGPGIEELPADVRDTLAGIPDDRLGEFAEQWEQIQEFADLPPATGHFLEIVTELRSLAQRARKEDQMIYCWMAV
ncbi:hypothetical protein AB0K16_27245 [Nonomuraea jabiensis]|uniref:hypothetical protein n=1 Tax=Nonomuraea jabiensis TaxID=882448 RepID=UPI0034396689